MYMTNTGRFVAVFRRQYQKSHPISDQPTTPVYAASNGHYPLCFDPTQLRYQAGVNVLERRLAQDELTRVFLDCICSHGHVNA